MITGDTCERESRYGGDCQNPVEVFVCPVGRENDVTAIEGWCAECWHDEAAEGYWILLETITGEVSQ